MIEFSLPLIKNYERPIIDINGLFAVIDTGAMVPIF